MTTCIQYFGAIAGILLLTFVPARAGESEVKGTFNGDGKPAKLAFVSAYPGRPSADKGTIVLVFTEKEQAKSDDVEMAAAVGDFGSALVVTVNAAGEIVSCDVAHQAHAKKPFTSIGTLKLSDYKKEGGNVQGKLSTGGKADFMGESWEVDLTFKTKAP